MERNLYLAAQLLELERPLVMALNMSDVAKEMGVHIDIKKLSELTGATIVETVGRNNVGTTELLQAVIDVAKEAKKPSATIDYGPELEPAIRDIVNELEKADTITYPLRWVAIKLLEADPDVIKKVKAFERTEAVLAKAEQWREELKDKVDLEIIFQEFRHSFAVATYNNAIKVRLRKSKPFDRIDKVLTTVFGAYRFSYL